MVIKKYKVSNRLAKYLEKSYAPLETHIDKLHEATEAFCSEGLCRAGKNLKQMSGAIRSLEPRLAHILWRERKQLYPFIETHVPRFQPLISVLLSEHDDLRRLLGGLSRSLTLLQRKKEASRRCQKIHKISEEGTYLVCYLRNHFWVENSKIFKALNEELHVYEKEKLIRLLNSLPRGKR